MLVVGRIRIQVRTDKLRILEAQKHTDPSPKDPDPEHGSQVHFSPKKGVHNMFMDREHKKNQKNLNGAHIQLLSSFSVISG